MKKRAHLLPFFLCVCLVLSFSFQEQQKNDEESTKLIKEYTTDTRFLNPLIDHIPDHPAIPSPREVLGYVAGAPKKMTYYADIIRYLEILAEKSDKVMVLPIGKTNYGRMMHIAVISSSDTLQSIDTCKQYAAALSDPRKTSEVEANTIIKKTKPIYYISCNLHSEETGSAEMSMELAYRLAASEKEYIQNILDNVIIVLLPCLEPDGHDTVTDFYYKYRMGIDNERSRFPEPPYWGKYVFHDNNRDTHVTQPLTQNAVKMLLEWHPQIHTDLHEPFAFLYISPGKGPFREAVDPLLIEEWHWLTFYEITELTKYGMPGVWTHGFSASWFPGYLFEMSNLHNAVGRFYETLGNAGATTVKRTRKFSEEVYSGIFEFYSRQWYRPFPPLEEVLWSHRNNVNYQQSGILSSLKNVANNRETILHNFWIKGSNAVERGKSEAPYAWIVPVEQIHLVETANLLNLLITQGVEIHQLEEEFVLKGRTFVEGCYVVRMDQPYRIYALTMLDVQKFPEAYTPPYDDTGWTLGYMHGVETVRIDEPAILDAKVSLVEGKIRIKGKIADGSSGYGYVIPHHADNNLVTARFALRGMDVHAAEETFKANGKAFPPGSFIIPTQGDEGMFSSLKSVVEDLGLEAFPINSEPSVKKHLLNLPHIALYHTWTYTQDSGWVRFAFDQYQIPYAYISKDRIREGKLKDEFDVIVIPRQGGAKSIVHGIDPVFSPISYEKSDKFQFLGLQDESMDITGGMGFIGLQNLKEFIEQGGILVLLDRASQLATDFGLVRYVSLARTPGLVIPGSILKGEVANPKSPIVYGYDTHIPLFHSFGILFNIPEEEQKYVVLKYSGEDDMCMSGVVKGKGQIKGKAALVDVPVGEGRVVLFNFNPIHRFQNKVDFMLVFNTLMNFDDLDVPE